MSNERPPLWRVMSDACYCAPCSQRDILAAEIRALADWLVPETDEPDHIIWPNKDTGCWDTSQWDEWRFSQKLRQTLLAEADRAEQGEP